MYVPIYLSASLGGALGTGRSRTLISPLVKAHLDTLKISYDGSSIEDAYLSPTGFPGISGS